ncbi:hypothetical protein [Bizionia arctica]|uniref:Uncharacterized protein n=1 Tax=Bizionia arctica TaxID=1495645 RepID=A0A917GNR2_9FLAO|nr:hypothetical protein [Bizionia arctica]GGG52420.1 hypothetical protein GCM10010976_24430 [Bizionia arctica]
MRKLILFLTITFIIISCKKEKRLIEKIEFGTKYKFSSEIEREAFFSKDYQRSGTDFALKGDYKNALIHWDLGKEVIETSLSKEQIDSINIKYIKVKALDYVIEKAKKNHIVIINEAHHNSLHRVFTKSLLKDLYHIGYTNLGIEALTSNDSLNSALNNRKYPIQTTGYYTKDPQFGNLIRTALEIGYTLFPYETTNYSDDSDELREIEQAESIQKVIESKPNEKFLIYCGYGHALEGTHRFLGKTMAGRLTEFTGINPLTIDQTLFDFNKESKPEFNSLLEALQIKESSVLIEKDNNPLRYEENDTWIDIAVFHPNTEYIDDRPNWLFENGNKNVSILLTDIQIEFPVMVLAYKKGEDINIAIPIDIKEVERKTENCNLGLSIGTYEIVVTNGKETVKFEQTVQ